MFFTLAWLGHWAFGPEKVSFATLRLALWTCFQMLIGEYPFEDEWKEGTLQKVWYVSFTFLVYIVSLNVLLAIIVESFLKVKKHIEEACVTELNLIIDLGGLIMRAFLGYLHGWPTSFQVMLHLEVTKVMAEPVTAQELHNSQFVDFAGRREAQLFLEFYFRLVGRPILAPQGKEYLRQMTIKNEVHSYLGAVFGFDAANNHAIKAIEKATAKIQCAWRGTLARKRIQKRSYAMNEKWNLPIKHQKDHQVKSQTWQIGS
eukprot:gnl/MRDRNA2_/MRDRNA2_66594_c0_seq2.p1 gnl/MRDRNA2_/MRDRNA2_66594_c0~~gnl/MRDRNA2_/MRDRNA2_66594_c0_seq2.p1  ORF type:complete len:282 (+),score=43.36 gnl/MRDRNA2_/MRDRNA2_66594_c0_seq2:70-846(+)